MNTDNEGPGIALESAGKFGKDTKVAKEGG